MVKKFLRGVGLKLGIRWLMARIRETEEGRYGPRAQTGYRALVRRSAWVALVLSLFAGELAFFGLNVEAGWTMAAAGVLVQLKIIDAAWRASVPVELLSHRAYRFLLNRSLDVAAVIGLALAALEDAACGRWCEAGSTVLMVVGAALVQLGILEPAWRGRGPVDADRLARLQAEAERQAELALLDMVDR